VRDRAATLTQDRSLSGEIEQIAEDLAGPDLLESVELL